MKTIRQILLTTQKRKVINNQIIMPMKNRQNPEVTLRGKAANSNSLFKNNFNFFQCNSIIFFN